MAYPPSDPAATKTNDTATPNDHPNHHNALANAVVDIVDELGAGPKGASADVTARLSTLDTTVSGKVGTGDSRLTDARTPSGAAGGDLTGTYPNPTLQPTGPGATGPVGDATHVAAVTVDAKGRVTAPSSVSISAGGGAPSGPAGGVLAGSYPDPTFAVDMATQAELDAVAAAAATPWLVTIDGYLPPFAHTNWNNLWTGASYRSPVSGDAGATTYPYRASTGAQNAELQYKLLLGAGTWAFDLHGLVSASSGIMTVLIDSVSVGTIDLYHTSLAYSYVQSLTGITVATTGVKTVILRMATKNGSSANYYGYIQTAQFRRTA